MTPLTETILTLLQAVVAALLAGLAAWLIETRAQSRWSREAETRRWAEVIECLRITDNPASTKTVHAAAKLRLEELGHGALWQEALRRGLLPDQMPDPNALVRSAAPYGRGPVLRFLSKTMGWDTPERITGGLGAYFGFLIGLAYFAFKVGSTLPPR